LETSTRRGRKIPKRHLTIWCADANGEIGKIKAEEDKPRRIFGPYRKQEKAEKETENN